MPRKLPKILLPFFGLLFIGNAWAQTISFPAENMPSRIERIAETAKENRPPQPRKAGRRIPGG